MSELKLRPPKNRATNFGLGTLASGGLGCFWFMGNLGEELCDFLFAIFLIEALVDFGDLGGVHGAEFRAAHGAELGFLVEIVRERLVVHGAGGLGIEGELELLFPIEEEAGIAEGIVAVARAGAMPSDIRGVGRDLIGDNALAD